MIQIITGKQAKPKRVVIYGPEGIGKSNLASQCPNPVFSDIEGGTAEMDNVKRLPKASSWAMLKEHISALKKDHMGFQTLVVDTADWAERLCLRHICDVANKASIEDFGYGKGFVMAEEEWGRFLDSLTDLTEATGMNVVLLAHAHLKKFEQPDESGSYDRWELKLTKKLSPLTKEWADAVLFANYETFVVEDEKTKSKKAQGGTRVIHTTHHVAWDAKNRSGLPDKLKFPKVGAWDQFPSDFFATSGTATPAPAKAEEQIPHLDPEPVAEPRIPQIDKSAFPANLWELIDGDPDGITEEEIQKVVALRGYYPEETPISNYEKQFVDGVLVAAWPKVKAMIIEQRSK